MGLRLPAQAVAFCREVGWRAYVSVVLAANACGPSVKIGADADEGATNAADTLGQTEAGDHGDGNDDGNPYDECLFDYYGHPHIECSGAFGGTAPDSCFACSCAGVECSRDSDCPRPATGNAQPECYRGGACILSCDDDTSCPEGMRCGKLNAEDSLRICVEALDDPLVCASMGPSAEWPDPCPVLADEASCEVLTSEAGFACKWATHSMYQVPSDDCAPLEVTESCIMTARGGDQSLPDICVPFGFCATMQTRVFFEDLGAGTVRLIAFEDCELQLRPSFVTGGNSLDYCDYDGTFPFPVICGCGCTEPENGDSTSG